MRKKKMQQYPMARCDFTSFQENENGALAVLDMTDAYKMNGAKKVQRSFCLSQGYRVLTITDTIRCYRPSEVYWFMHTKAEISISEDGKTAILSRDGKRLQAESLQDGGFSVMPAQALKGAYEYDADYAAVYQKLCVHLQKATNAVMEIRLTPIDDIS